MAQSAWGTDYVVSPLAGGIDPSLTDPYVAVGANGSSHHLSIEVELVNNPALNNCAFNMFAPTRNLVYRRGGSALEIANLTAIGTNLKLVTADFALDHGGMTVTADGTRHFIYQETGGVKTRSLSPSDIFSAETSWRALAVNLEFSWAPRAVSSVGPAPPT